MSNHIPDATTMESDSITDDTTPTQPSAPDGGYGWVIVGACFTLNAFTWGVTAVSTHAASVLDAS
jgi:hypothetical protein